MKKKAKGKAKKKAGKVVKLPVKKQPVKKPAAEKPMTEEEKRQQLSKVHFALNGVQVNALLNYLGTRPYNEVGIMIEQIRALPQVVLNQQAPKK